MAKVYNDISETVGQTPLVRINRLPDECPATILAKLEFFNPLSSIKDRVGKAMIESAEQSGQLKPGTVIIEPTSGNTGIALAFMAAVKGYRLILTMPESMSIERRALLLGLGAELELTPSAQGMQGAVERAFELARSLPDALVLQQFSNPANPDIHRSTTAQEIWDDTGGRVDYLVGGIGTGGSITGIGQALKALNPKVKVIGVEPATSAVVSGKSAGPHNIQGIGAGFVPRNLDRNILDECVRIQDEDAFEAARQLARNEGIPAGISSGATFAAALKVAARPTANGKTIVVIFASCAERYLSTPLYRDLIAEGSK
ncbi:MAG: cysteine synthase A [Myxococcota bacterium]|nr:cysteine synthase A [Myxococcota bacterium]